MATTKIEWAATPNADGTLKPGRSDWNPVRGCTRVSPGCGGPGPHGGCYAEGIASRFSGPGLAFHGFAEKIGGKPHWTGRVEVMWDRLTDPLKWREPATIFALSMSDLFHEKLPVDQIAKIYAVMVAAVHVRRHTFQVLTKRSERMREILNSAAFWRQVNAEAGAHVMECTDVFNRMRGDARATLDEYGPHNPPPGIWLGVSVEDQIRADERIPDLLATPAAIRFLVCEPLLGPLDIAKWLKANYECSEGCGYRNVWAPTKERCHWCGWSGDRAGEFCPECGRQDFSAVCPDCGSDLVFDHPDTPILSWIIGGGESGPNARDNDFLTNARSLRDQCRAAGVPFFGKQNVRKAPLPEDLMVREFPLSAHREMPNV